MEAKNSKISEEVILVSLNDGSSDDGSAATYGAKPNEIQVSVHSVGQTSFLREACLIFPSQDFVNDMNLIMIPTMQHAQHDLVKVGPEIEEEKDRLLLTFFEFGKLFCAKMQEAGAWADYIDPCSGLPMIFKDGNKVFDEVQSASTLLSYSTMNCGCCKVLLHPDWGSAVYPSSVFTTASPELVRSVLDTFGKAS